MVEINDKPNRERLPKLFAVLFVTSIGLMIRMPWSGRVAAATFDLLHGPVFCIVAWMLMWLVPPTTQKKHMRMRLGLALMLVLFGALAEYTQQFVGRTTSWHDLVANCLGVLAGHLMFEWMLRRQQRFGIVPLVTGIIVLLAAVRPGVTELIDCVRVHREFPLLDSFENGRARWRSSEATLGTILDPQLATHGQYALQWHLAPGQYPSCQMGEPPRDWTRYDRLEFDIQLASNAPVEQLVVVLKVHDEQHETEFGLRYDDRFHQELLLFKGEWQKIAIDLKDIENAPAARKMDLTRMQVLELFAIDQSQAITVYVDHVRLAISAE